LLKVIILLSVSLLLISCNKENNTKPRTGNQENIETEDESDSTLTPEEAFSAALTSDISQDEDITDLQIYLEEQIYPEASKSAKVTLDRISGSLFLLSYDAGGNFKNFYLQKYYDPVSQEVKFEKTEVQTDAKKQFTK
jgi:hypothetical protein